MPEPIVCIVGPTATGKTALAVALARALDGEVVSCDSMQLYRRMEIGTAKPTAEETAGVPHHMIDVCEPDEPFSAGRYVALADAAVQDILSRGRTVIVAGGTGLYVDSLMAGRDFAPAPATGVRQALERRTDEVGTAAMLAELREIDPERAALLHSSDRKRILRALEIYYETGQTITAHDRESRAVPTKYEPVWIGLDFADRAALYRRIDARVDEMLRRGLWDEVRGLLRSGVPPDATAMQAIGYKEAAAAIRGEISFNEAAAQIKQGSRRYAKRQRTWFRRNEKIHWILLPDPPEASAALAEALSQIPFRGGAGGKELP